MRHNEIEKNDKIQLEVPDDSVARAISVAIKIEVSELKAFIVDAAIFIVCAYLAKHIFYYLSQIHLGIDSSMIQHAISEQRRTAIGFELLAFLYVDYRLVVFIRKILRQFKVAKLDKKQLVVQKNIMATLKQILLSELYIALDAIIFISMVLIFYLVIEYMHPSAEGLDIIAGFIGIITFPFIVYFSYRLTRIIRNQYRGDVYHG
jgi:hypothetical protein